MFIAKSLHGIALMLMTAASMVMTTDIARAAATLAGDWKGDLIVPGAALPLVFHFTQAGDVYTLTLDSPNQGAFGIVGGKVTFDGANVTALVPALHGEFDGKLSEDGSSLTGSWSQGSPLPLTLIRAAPEAPSDPIPPMLIGNWSGLLKTGEQTLHLTFHFVQNGDNVVCQADCPEQKLFEIGGAPVTNHSGMISAPFPTLNGALKGTISEDGSTFTGTWQQVGEAPIVLLHSAPTPPSALPDALGGSWLGSLLLPSGNIRIVLKFVRKTGGAYGTTFISPDQSGAVYDGIVTAEPDQVIKADFTKIGISFRGLLSDDQKSLYGLLSQGGHGLELTLTKTSRDVEGPPRPQNPEPPFPYDVRAIVFPSVAHGIELAGTMTSPKHLTLAPAVVLIAGSGGQDRDENIYGHKIFAVIADYLTRRGFVVLRYDKRGVGKSTGDFASSTIADFADDAQGAVNYLNTVEGVDPRRIGIIGHSEGGMIAPLLAVRDPDVHYVVLLAGPGVDGVDVLLRQQVLIAEGEGASKEFVKKNYEYQKVALPIAAKGSGDEADRARLVALYQKTFAGTATPPELAAQIAPAIQQIFTPWYRSFLNFDPQNYLTKMTVPALALNGSRDRQVDPMQNLPAIRAALTRSDAGNFEVVEIPGLNHLFQDCKTGAFSEYEKIEETFSPRALQIMGDWLIKTTRN